jgi:hypothetical protein
MVHRRMTTLHFQNMRYGIIDTVKQQLQRYDQSSWLFGMTARQAENNSEAATPPDAPNALTE